MLGLVRRNIWYCTESIKETLYVDFVWPKLECAAVARDPRIKSLLNSTCQTRGNVESSSPLLYTNDHDWSSPRHFHTKQIGSMYPRRKEKKILFDL